jgi:general secretion pathway protein A
MYQEYFGFRNSPFELSPDPSFFFPSEKSTDALASISYAVSQRKGFLVMTGEVGTGKTLILRCLLELWERERLPYVYFIGPKLSTMDFLQYVALELEIKLPNPTKGTLLRALYGFLFAQFEKDLTTLLIIDEAHHLTQGVLEEIRLLANFETAQQKLLQVLLVGQPELDQKLDSLELRSLKQRIAVRCHLEPFGGEETLRYIRQRLELAGGTHGSAIFPPDTIQSIHRYSSGIPRLINCICDQALMSAYARKLRTVHREIIDEVASRFRLTGAGDVRHTETFSPTSQTGRPAQDGLRQARGGPVVTTTGDHGANANAAIKAFGSRQQETFEERVARRAKYR